MRRARRVVAASKRTRRPLCEYESPAQAAEKYGMAANSVRYQCNSRSMGNLGVYFRWADEFDPDERFEATRGLPVEVTFPDGGVEVYAGIGDAAEANGVSYTTIKDAAATGRTLCGLKVRTMRCPRR